MAQLHQRGYQTLGLMDVVEGISSHSFPDRSLVITFDDGYRSVYEKAFPLLQAHNLTATVFLTVGADATKPTGCLPTLNGMPMLDWSEIREMHRWGIIFGAHTQTHPDLTRLSPDHIEAELYNSKNIVEDALGAPVNCFAYPFGRYNRCSYSLAMRYFKCACSDKLGLVTNASDPFVLERVDAYYLRTNRLFDFVFSKHFPAYIRLRAIPRQIKRRVTIFPAGKD